MADEKATAKKVRTLPDGTPEPPPTKHTEEQEEKLKSLTEEQKKNYTVE